MKKILLISSLFYFTIIQLNAQGVFCHPSIAADCVNQPNYIDSVVTTGALQNFSNAGTNCNTQDNNYAFYKYFLVAEYRLDSFDLRVALNKTTLSKIGVWVDWNKDSIFSAAENIYTSAAYETGVTIKVVVPSNANLDTLIMRVRTAPAFTSSCDPSSTGETEDYRFLVLNDVSGIKNINKQVGFKVYPNPANDIITVSLNHSANYVLELSDISGRVVYSSNMVNTKTIDVSNLQKGNYFIRLKNENQSFIEKIVIN